MKRKHNNMDIVFAVIQTNLRTGKGFQQAKKKKLTVSVRMA